MSVMVRVSQDVHAELMQIQQAFYAEHRVQPSLSAVIERLLADRRAWRAMGEAAREADRKPVRS